MAGFFTLSLSSGLIWYGFSIRNKPIADEFGWGRGEVLDENIARYVGADPFERYNSGAVILSKQWLRIE